MPARLDHVTLVASDLDRSAAFLDGVLSAAGLERVVAYQDFEDEDEVGEEAVGYGTGEDVVLWLVAGRRPTHAAHVVFQVTDAAAVDAVAAAGGGVARAREHDRPGYYGTTVTDPDGNGIEVYALRR